MPRAARFFLFFSFALSCSTSSPPAVEESAATSATVKRFYYADHLGSTVAVTDETGQVVCREEYLPWGEEYSITGECGDRKYNGRILDEETGLYYYNARYYDPTTARFISADSALGTPANPQTGNRYAYVLDNPYKWIDPTGHETAFPWKSHFEFDRAVNNFAAGFVRGFTGINAADNNDDYMSVAYGNGEIAGAGVSLATAVYGLGKSVLSMGARAVAGESLVLFRSDARLPSQVAASGMVPRRDMAQFSAYTMEQLIIKDAEYPTGAFVNAGRDLKYITSKFGNRGYIYKIRMGVKEGWETNAFFPDNPHALEQEWKFLNVKPSQVEGYWRATDYKLQGPFIKMSK